jgi:hypothetical protein
MIYQTKSHTATLFRSRCPHSGSLASSEPKRPAWRLRWGPGSRRGWFEADFVVDRISESLLAAQISLRRLDAHMAEQELDLLKLSTLWDVWVLSAAGPITPHKSASRRRLNVRKFLSDRQAW